MIADGFEQVYAVLDLYDGPTKGLSAVDGVPHYFEWDFDQRSAADEEYFVWPASEEAAAMEREQWAIYVAYEVSDAGLEMHPGTGGVDARYDELGVLLAPHRQKPDGARRLVGEARFDDGERYRPDGGDVWFRWSPSRRAQPDNAAPNAPAS